MFTTFLSTRAFIVHFFFILNVVIKASLKYTSNYYVSKIRYLSNNSFKSWLKPNCINSNSHFFWYFLLQYKHLVKFKIYFPCDFYALLLRINVKWNHWWQRNVYNATTLHVLSFYVTDVHFTSLSRASFSIDYYTFFVQPCKMYFTIKLYFCKTN